MVITKILAYTRQYLHPRMLFPWLFLYKYVCRHLEPSNRFWLCCVFYDSDKTRSEPTRKLHLQRGRVCSITKHKLYIEQQLSGKLGAFRDDRCDCDHTSSHFWGLDNILNLLNVVHIDISPVSFISFRQSPRLPQTVQAL